MAEPAQPISLARPRTVSCEECGRKIKVRKTGPLPLRCPNRTGRRCRQRAWDRENKSGRHGPDT